MAKKIKKTEENNDGFEFMALCYFSNGVYVNFKTNDKTLRYIIRGIKDYIIPNEMPTRITVVGHYNDARDFYVAADYQEPGMLISLDDAANMVKDMMNDMPAQEVVDLFQKIIGFDAFVVGKDDVNEKDEDKKIVYITE